MMQDVARIAMWSGPRNISTAMMRSFENRADAVVWDEPFYAHYLAETGLDHAMADEIIAAYENDWRKVADKAVGPGPGGGAGLKSVISETPVVYVAPSPPGQREVAATEDTGPNRLQVSRRPSQPDPVSSGLRSARRRVPRTQRKGHHMQVPESTGRPYRRGSRPP